MCVSAAGWRERRGWVDGGGLKVMGPASAFTAMIMVLLLLLSDYYYLYDCLYYYLYYPYEERGRWQGASRSPAASTATAPPRPSRPGTQRSGPATPAPPPTHSARSGGARRPAACFALFRPGLGRKRARRRRSAAALRCRLRRSALKHTGNGRRRRRRSGAAAGACRGCWRRTCRKWSGLNARPFVCTFRRQAAATL